jgi:ferredoxin-NADP reductase
MYDYCFPIIHKKLIAPNTYELTFATEDSNYSFEAGQYADFTLLEPFLPQSDKATRTFSFVNAPHEGKHLTIALRFRPTLYKNALLKLGKGDRIGVSRAIGFFALPEGSSAQPIVFWAGGIGSVPFVSLLRDIHYKGKNYDISCVISNRSPESAVYLDEFFHLDAHKVHTHFSRTHGRLTTRIIAQFVPHAKQSVHYLAGPPQFVEAIIDSLISLGVPLAHIKMEAFTGY